MNHITDSATVRTRKPRGQGASRRGEILDAAKRLFTEEGFSHATMRRIAAEVGVSPTALYLHFADKEAILRAIAQDFFADLLVRLQETQTTGLPPLARLRAGLRAYVDMGIERADEYRLTFQNRAIGTLQDPEQKPAEADMTFDVLVHSVEDLIAQGHFRAGDPVLMSETIWIAMHGAVTATIDLPGRLHCGSPALVDTLIDAVITGFTCAAARG